MKRLLCALCVCTLFTHVFCEEETDFKGLLGLSTDDVKNRMKTIFEHIDTDSNGKLTYNETTIWLDKLHKSVTQRSIKLEMESLDEDKDGVVTVEEIFKRYGADEESDPHFREKVEVRVKAVDADGDGAINMQEAEKFLYPSTDRDLVELDALDVISQQDKDKDGKISKEEFLQHLKNEDGGNTEDGDRLAADFDQYDTNKDGHLDKEELSNVLVNSQENHKEDGEKFWTESVGSHEATIDLEDVLTNLTKWATSQLTDLGEVLRFPREYDLDMDNVEEDTSLGEESGDDAQQSGDSESEETPTPEVKDEL